MEAAEGAEPKARARREPEPVPGGAAQRGPPLSGTSYWLDLWLFILFDLLLLVFFYLLP